MKLSNTQKFCFIGVSIGSDSSNESGITVIDRDLNLIKTDKAYHLSELKAVIANFAELAPFQNTVMCVDLPRNIMMLNGKWRIVSKQTQILKLNRSITETRKTSVWKNRYSDRGAEICTHFAETGMDVFRYNSLFTINQLNLTPPYRIRMPAGCKFLQSIIDEKLGIQGIPSNLLPLPTMFALIGAYIAWKIGQSREDFGYRQISTYKNLPVVSALKEN